MVHYTTQSIICIILSAPHEKKSTQSQLSMLYLTFDQSLSNCTFNVTFGSKLLLQEVLLCCIEVVVHCLFVVVVVVVDEVVFFYCIICLLHT